MVVVIFRARVKNAEPAYDETGARMRALAFEKYGCLAFHAMADGDDELAISYWPDEDHVARWRADPAHREAQRVGRERWYASYAIDVAHVTRSYARDLVDG